MQILLPIKTLHQEGLKKKQPFPFSVNFLFNEALALACFDGKVEDGIDDLPRIEPGLFSHEGSLQGWKPEPWLSSKLL